MSRYLTAAKIGLLALVDVYVSGAVPDDATVSVLHFMASHLIDGLLPLHVLAHAPAPADRWEKPATAAALMISIEEFEQVLSPHGAASLPGRRLWDVFLKKLWRIDSLDALHRFFADDLRRLLALTKEERLRAVEQGKELPRDDAVRLSRNSPFGAFVRRSRHEFTRLSFQKTAELWESLVRYRQPTAGYWRRWNPGIDSLAFDSVLLAGQHDWGPAVHGLVEVVYGDLRAEGQPDASTRDIEMLLEFQVNQIKSEFLRSPAASTLRSL